jgi:Type I phosphodiesterase / nucleotide pyrophosphatase
MKPQITKNRNISALAALLFLAALAARPLHAAPPDDRDRDDNHIRHVLLVSIDGMHALDFIKCANGIAGANNGAPYCPNLAQLKSSGIDFLQASTSRPSDSFPGLMSIVSGGSPKTFGAFYDVAYDRSLEPPTIMTGNGVASGNCTAGSPPTGTTTEFDEGIDLDKTELNGGAPAGVDGGVRSIDPLKLERDPANNCSPVFPWNFVRTNTIFGVIHGAGGYTAWSDKHPSYSSVSGPGNGPKNLDDYYAPEINSIPVSLPGISVGAVSCDPLPDQNAVAASNAWTDSFQNIECYDTLKVNAVLNEIDGFTHNRSAKAPVPTIFGMNFQAVSVGQKLIEKKVGSGGYLDATGTPSALLLGEIQFVDAAVGQWVSELKKRGLYNSTLIIISAKHGQSPVDSSRYTGITTGGPITTSPATILQDCLPFSESPANSNGIGPTEDDVSLIWLSSSCTTSAAVGTLESTSPASANIAGIGQIYFGSAITQLFNAPGLPPNGDPRTPDILVTPNIGVTYSGSTKKQAEHGGFSHDDTNVIMLLSNPSFDPKTISAPVQTAQIAPTILAALGLDPNALQSVREEGTPVLPGVPLGGDNDHR